LKVTREEQQVKYIDKPIRIADFSTETLKAIRAWNDISLAMKENYCQQRLMYLAKVSFTLEGEIKTLMRNKS
jgi:hypothetical protein